MASLEDPLEILGLQCRLLNQRLHRYGPAVCVAMSHLGILAPCWKPVFLMVTAESPLTLGFRTVTRPPAPTDSVLGYGLFDTFAFLGDIFSNAALAMSHVSLYREHSLLQQSHKVAFKARLHASMTFSRSISCLPHREDFHGGEQSMSL